MSNIEFDKKYDISSNSYSGVLVNKKLAIKLYKLLAKHQEEIYQLLVDNLDSLGSSNWTLAYPDDKQTEVRFIDPNESDADKINRLRVFKLRDKIKKHKLVLHAKSMQKAEYRFLKRLGQTDKFRGNKK
jgi:hypothetical protein